ncbi:hypothetical protein CAEBREN_28994 [Caenorhabditis brenneri]|uniref:ABC-type glutathione-S-conjugate transporter n=1 Tax=Caenorhabditis brenneri TaxID=135651 RepID=G0P3C9_CAEBE|nr:hypothetical protein CAEBREN_28994 [Caenorhabditis brenneri]
MLPLVRELVCGSNNKLLEHGWRNSTALPQVTDCGQHTDFSTIPTIFLIIFSPIVFYELYKSRNGHLRSYSPISLRIILCCLLVVDLTATIIYDFYLRFSNSSIYNAIHFYGDLVQYAGFCLALVLTIACRNRGIITSGVVTLYWLLIVVCGIPEFRYYLSGYIYEEYEVDHIRAILYIASIAFSSLELFLCCFVDTPANGYVGVSSILKILFIYLYSISPFHSLFSYLRMVTINKILFQKNSCPEHTASFFNQLSFQWFSSLAYLGNRKPLEKEDLWDLNERDKAENLIPSFISHLKPEIDKYRRLIKNNPAAATPKNHPSILWPIFKTYKFTFLAGGCYKLIFDLMQFIAPELLKQLISFIEDENQPMWIGVSIAFLMFLSSLIQSLILHQYFHEMFRLGMNIRSVLTSAVYTKTLNLSNEAKKQKTTGAIVNLMSVDIQRVQDMTTFIMLFWSAPLQILLSLYFLWKLLGVSVLAGFIILILLIPLNSYISIKMRNCQMEQMKYKDERMKLMSEILNGMKVLKLYSWEQSMEKMVLDIREKEIRVLKRLSYLNAATTLSWACAPFLVAVMTFGIYVLWDPENNILTPQITFVALALFNILRFPLAVFAMVFSQAVQCAASNTRLKEFFAADEMAPQSSIGYGGSETAIKIEDGSFAWGSKEEDKSLCDININIKKGQLVAIVGRVGSGKSSLLHALLASATGCLGTKTRVFVTHGLNYLKYCDQVIVLKNGTVSEMGTYQELMNSNGAFAEFLEEFLMEESKHRGRSVSFGEDCRLFLNVFHHCCDSKQLCRCCFSAKDVYEILRDMDQVSPGFRKRIQSQMSQEIVKNDELNSETVRNNEPEQTPQGNFVKNEEKESLLGAKPKEQPLEIPKQAKPKLIEKETVETGKVKLEIYMSYFRSIGIPIAIMFFLVYIASSVLGVVSNLYLARWSDDAKKIAQAGNVSTSETQGRLAIYAMLGMGQASSVCAASVIMALGMVRASRLLHGGLLKNTMRSPMAFFDVTPLGRILNRFGKDIEAVDQTLPHSSRAMVMTIFNVISTVVVIIWATPYAGFAFIFLGFIYFIVLVRLMFECLLITNKLILCMYYFEIFQRKSRYRTCLRCSFYDVDVIDSRLPSCILTFVGAIVQAVTIFAVPVYATPASLLIILPTLYGYLRILDVDGIDVDIPRSMLMFVRTAVATIEILVIILCATPFAISVLLPLLFVYLLVVVRFRFYVSVSRQLKRLESASRSPIYSHFQESIQGASSIRAYGVVDKFIKESQLRVDENLSTYYPSIVANRWLAVRLEMVGNLIVFSAAGAAVYFRGSPGLTAGLVGLSVSYALNVSLFELNYGGNKTEITQTLNWAVRMTSELETNIVAVERINEYTITPTEGKQSTDSAPSSWPNKGEIFIKNFSIRYRPGLELVLHGVTAHIKPCEKVGIVGRTGAGKSSLTLALFRIIEADEGCIEIDGVNIANLQLEQLRSCLTIVPQDPVLFSGTMRMNLDPFNAFQDFQIWEALKNAHLAPFVESLQEGLQHHISEGGENLSVGQRQLICLARALLRKSKVLVLDEAAAAVDVETDSLLRKTISEQFNNCTVLTIAHRLNTVIDSDRLLVLDRGVVAEFDTPKKLLSDTNGLFYSMAKDANII